MWLVLLVLCLTGAAAAAIRVDGRAVSASSDVRCLKRLLQLEGVLSIRRESSVKPVQQNADARLIEVCHYKIGA